MNKKRSWNKKEARKGPLKINSLEKGADRVCYVTLEQWFDNLENIGTAIILPEVKELCIRSWWISNFLNNRALKGKQGAYIKR